MRLRKLKGKIKLIMDDYKKDVPLKEMAIKYGVSRQSIWKIVKERVDPDRRIMEYKEIVCRNTECKKVLKVQQCRKEKYCSNECYIKMRIAFSIMENSSNVTNRASRLNARKLIDLLPGQVVHHIDGDVANNEPNNLMVFNSNSEHISYHHKMRINSGL